MTHAAPLCEPVAARATRVAIVVNENASRVDRRLVRDLHAALPEPLLFVSSTVDQFELIARQIASHDPDVVLCAGGDGTFVRCVSDVLALGPSRPPVFGVLRLGTGNALAASLGASADPVADLALARRPENWTELSLLRVDGRLAPFVGAGADALILEDYNRLRRVVARTPFTFLGQGALGYWLALVTRSLWRLVVARRAWVTIRNEGAPAWRMDRRGGPVGEPIRPGSILYRGPTSFLAASTIPHYGFGLRLFPQVTSLVRRFQLRVLDLGAFSVLLRLPAFYRGELYHDRIHDFACSAISVEADTPLPFQIGGDEAGRRTSMRLELARVRAVAFPRRP